MAGKEGGHRGRQDLQQLSMVISRLHFIVYKNLTVFRSYQVFTNAFIESPDLDRLCHP